MELPIVDKPMFDLVLGTKTMNELGIILHFKHEIITIDEIELPMASIEDMPISMKSKALALNNNLAVSKEPKSTEEASTHHVVVHTCTCLNSDKQICE
jgi:hypothetical protein